jgi:hypothetical protein
MKDYNTFSDFESAAHFNVLIWICRSISDNYYNNNAKLHISLISKIFNHAKLEANDSHEIQRKNENYRYLEGKTEGCST